MRTTKPHVKKWKWGSPQTSWVVDGLRDQNGTRKRKFFPSRDAADAWLAERRPELKNQGRSALGMSDRQRVDAVKALALLAPFGATLTEAAEAFADRARVLSRTVTFAKLREEYLNAQRADRKSAQYLTDIKHRLLRVGKTFDARPVASIETRELDDWLRGLSAPAEGSQSPISRHNFRKVMRTAFEFAVSRGYARDNPVVKTAEVKVDHPTPGILKPHEIAAILAEADSSIIPALALSAFAGLRDAEVGRMTWDRVDLAGGHVKLDAAIAKTSSRRLIPISENLRAWLTPHVKKSGSIRPTTSVCSPLYRAARAAALKRLTKDKIAAPNLKEWPHNALRHSFVSYRMALVTNAAQVAEECGHSVQVMKTHYRELVTKKEAEAWFAIAPSTPANMITFTQATA